MNAILLLSALLLGARAGEPSAYPPDATIQAAPAPVPSVNVLSLYDSVRLALTEDRDADAVAAARALVAAADPDLAATVQTVVDATSLADRRVAFGNVSRLLVARLAAGDGPKVIVYRCPMVDTYPFWIQLSRGIGNPYMGTAMPTCGMESSLKKAAKP